MVAEVADGLWRWSTRHPEWHPRGFGDEVACFAARDGDGGLVVVDPLLPPEPDAVWSVLEGARAGPVTVVVTIPYHVRDAAAVAERLGGTVVGHRAVARRLPAGTAFRAVSPDDGLPSGVRVFAIGKPRRYEQPLWLPSHRALVFGDAIVESGGALRVWAQGRPLGPETTRFYHDRFAPTFAPLLALDPERILVTHGAPVLTGGRAALARALAAPPWAPPRAG
jgi:hypothetical protein